MQKLPSFFSGYERVRHQQEGLVPFVSKYFERSEFQPFLSTLGHPGFTWSVWATLAQSSPKRPILSYDERPEHQATLGHPGFIGGFGPYEAPFPQRAGVAQSSPKWPKQSRLANCPVVFLQYFLLSICYDKYKDQNDQNKPTKWDNYLKVAQSGQGQLKVAKSGPNNHYSPKNSESFFLDTLYTPSLPSSVDAVFAMAHSLHNLVIDKCCRGLPLQVAFADVLALCRVHIKSGQNQSSLFVPSA